MPKFKVGDLVRVKPAFWSLIGYRDELGVVMSIVTHAVLSVQVRFRTTSIFLSPDTLEKI